MKAPYPPFERPERVIDIWIEAWNRRDARTLANIIDSDGRMRSVDYRKE